MPSAELLEHVPGAGEPSGRAAVAPAPQPAERASRATGTAGIAGLGTALPETVVDTETIAASLGIEPEWIVRRTGIVRRRRLAEGERVSDLALGAARAALDDAGMTAGELDAVIVATSRGDLLLPYLSTALVDALGIPGAKAWDTSLACTGFLAALEQGAALVECGRARAALVVGAEGLSRMTDFTDRKTAGLFADGAGAVVLTPDGALRVGRSVLRTQAQEDELHVTFDDGYIRMDGQFVFKHAVAGMERACRDVLAAAELDVGDVSLVVPHQANARITLALRERLGLEAERVVDVIGELGNTSAASIPLALARARADGRLPAAPATVLLTAFGAGFAMGATLLEI